MGMNCRHGAQMVEVYFIPQVYCAYREYYGSASTRSTNTTTDKILPVLAVPAVQNPEILEAQGVSPVANPETL